MRLVLLASSLLSAVAFAPTAHHHRFPTTLPFSSTDYAKTIDALAKELAQTHEHLKDIEILAARLKDMELHNPHIGDIERNEALKQAVAEAKASIEAHGATSNQAKVALRKVDELAGERPPPWGTTAGDFKDSQPQVRYGEKSVQSHHAYSAILDSALITESMEAIEQVLLFEHFVHVEQTRLNVAGRRVPSEGENMPGVPWSPPSS